MPEYQDNAGGEALVLEGFGLTLIPIVKTFAKLKRLLRKAAERKKQETWRHIGTLTDQFSPRECPIISEISIVLKPIHKILYLARPISVT